MGDHHVGVIFLYKELTTSVVPKYTNNNKTWSDLLIFTQYMLHLRFDSNRDSIGNHTCRNLVIHMDMLSLQLSTSKIDDFALPMFICIGKRFHPCLESRSRISAEIRPYATSLAFSPPSISHSVSGRKTH